MLDLTVIKNQRSPDYFGNRISCWSGDQDGSEFTRPEIGALKKKKKIKIVKEPQTVNQRFCMFMF